MQHRVNDFIKATLALILIPAIIAGLFHIILGCAQPYRNHEVTIGAGRVLIDGQVPNDSEEHRRVLEGVRKSILKKDKVEL